MAPLHADAVLPGSSIRSRTVTTDRPPFHLAFPVHDLEAARSFYIGVLGCREGRSSDQWVDFDLCGHQIVAHLVADHDGAAQRPTNPVDGDDVPVPHFGVVLDPDTWRELAARLVVADVEVVIEPRTRFEGQPGEQSTLFVLDPSNNAIELKAFADPAMLFATSTQRESSHER